MKVIRVTALWCMSCLTMKKTWKKVFKEMPNLEIIDYDYDFDSEIVQELHIGKILPELIVYKNNQEVTRIIGEKTKKQLETIFEGLDEDN